MFALLRRWVEQVFKRGNKKDEVLVLAADKEAAKSIENLFLGATVRERIVGMTETEVHLYFHPIQQQVIFILSRETGNVIGCDSEAFSPRDLRVITEKYSEHLLGGMCVLDFYKATGTLK